MNTPNYDSIAEALTKYGYIVICDSFSKKYTKALFSKSQTVSNYKQAGVSSTNMQHIDTTERGDISSWLDEDGAEVSEYLVFNEGLRHYLNQYLYLGLHYYEAHFSIYEKGSFYKKHLDAFIGNKNRVITTLLYLNEEWDECDEGELMLYNMSNKTLEKIRPRSGTYVVFLSDSFPHEVLTTQKKRHSIAGWFREDSR